MNQMQFIYDQVTNLKCMLCLLAKQHIIYKRKNIIYVVLVSQGRVEIQTICGGKIYYFLIACIL